MPIPNTYIAPYVECTYDAPSAAISLPSVVQVDSRVCSHDCRQRVVLTRKSSIRGSMHFKCSFRQTSSHKRRRRYNMNAKMK